MQSIFVSYRRGDTSGHAGRICDRLRSHFRSAQVFMDVDTIRPGVDFVQVIEQAVGSSDVLLALIGDDWLTISDRFGNRRLDNADDFIRVEIAAALTKGIPVIPVLLEDARMPTAADLPPDLARLARINALEISDRRWDYDIGRLLAVLDGMAVTPAPPPAGDDPPPPTTHASARPKTSTPDAPQQEEPSSGTAPPARFPPPRKLVLAALVVLAISAAALLLLTREAGERGITIATAAVAPPAVDASGRQVTYEPAHTLDGNESTAWRMEGDGRGTRLSIDLGQRVSLRRIGVLPGYAKIDSLDQTNRFFQNRRIAKVRYSFDGGASVEQVFADSPITQYREVHVTTRRIAVEILETVPGDPNFDYTAISEIAIETADGERLR